MSLKKYSAYIKVIETGSLTKAAEILNYTQPNISQMISSLEEEYGFPLLIRQKNGVKPTKNGLAVLPAMRELQRGYEKLFETVHQINGLETGKIRIGAYTSIATNWLPKIVEGFKHLHPGIEIQIYEGNVFELNDWLEEDQIDVGIGTCHNNKWDFQPLVKEPILVIMSPQHKLANLNLISLKAIESSEFILPYSDSHFEVHNIFKEEQISPKIAYQVRGDETIISMVKNNLGISLLPKLLLSRCTEGIVIKPLEIDVSRELGIIMNIRKHTQTPSVNKMIQFINEWIKRDN
ncbi:LysR family transcriptional regulator [Priestia megaterium]|uniref:LysR family transcriptional regulator n=1 Tax=Priestia megaterium TaxID=1404 RepID=UPI00188FC5B6|nr:LysR family transcriptional regulator [Priestia megaterium]MCA4158110.1 LysR family transcriptional regulator [Priestia megaterium]